MDLGQKRVYGSGGGVLSGSLFGLNDLNDDDCRLEELPLKTRILKGNNFSELGHYWDSTSTTPTNSKKVRFERGDIILNENLKLDDLESGTKSRTESVSSSNKEKPHVEELIQYANQVNDYLSKNIENIDTFGAELLKKEGIYKPVSNVATENSSTCDSVSNFELSENEFDERDNPGSEIFNMSDRPSSRLSGAMNEKNYSRGGLEDSLSQYYETRQDEEVNKNNIFSNSPQLTFEEPNSTDLIHVQNSPELNMQLQDLQTLSIKSPQCPDENEIFNNNDNDDNTDTNSKYIPLLSCQHINSNEDTLINEISQEDAINYFLEAIDILLKLSDQNNYNNFIVEEASLDTVGHEFSHFKMKSTPTVNYKEFVDRIQSKCMLGSIIYLGCTYLLETLLLKRDSISGQLKLKYPLRPSHVHRVIIAIIRVSSKLLEDFVHSHEYITKVCGVSKRLLTKLEISLLFCVKNEKLLISSQELLGSLSLLKELKMLNDKF